MAASGTAFSTNVVIANSVSASICWTGIVLNSCLVYVTIKSKVLHDSCNVLICLYNFCAAFTMFSMSIKFFTMATGLNFIPLQTCYYILFIPLLLGPVANSLMLCIGVDRLLSVLFPLWYKVVAKKHVLIAYAIPCAIRTGYSNAIYLYVTRMYPEKMVICTPADMTPGDFGAFIYKEQLAFHCADFLCYLCIWLIILWRRKGIQNWAMVKQLMYSLTIIMSISLFCIIQGQVYRVILDYLEFDSVNSYYLVNLLTNCLYAIAYSSSTPVLCLISKEYRSAFGRCFPFMNCNSREVANTGTINLSNHNNSRRNGPSQNGWM